jgi:hypothetical protein
LDILLNTFPSETLIAESPLDIIEDFSVCFIQDVPELKVGWIRTVTEMLSK